ncbi:hypothetical protein [Brucella sp. 10RB9214]|uniref:hypothetical protein n=1 Tax=unclassified Brucella TaxID=2632610 RepID=UPI000972CF4F|nr:hypothetical protein BKD02_16725 [Brucella sp. 09RB8910]
MNRGNPLPGSKPRETVTKCNKLLRAAQPILRKCERLQSCVRGEAPEQFLLLQEVRQAPKFAEAWPEMGKNTAILYVYHRIVTPCRLAKQVRDPT